MMTMYRAVVLWVALVATTLVAPAATAKGQKYAKTEVEKAAGKCVGSILGGALLGAVVGRLIDKNGTAKGAAIGAGSGAVLCGILIANAKHRDRMVQAQLAAMNDPRRAVTDQWIDSNGQTTTFTTKAGDVRMLDGARLMPVRYQTIDGQTTESPVLDTGNRECRAASGSFTSGSSVIAAPAQLYCRTDAGDWRPFAEKTT